MNVHTINLDGERIAEISALIKKKKKSFILFFVEHGLSSNQTYSDQLFLIARHWFHHNFFFSIEL